MTRADGPTSTTHANGRVFRWAFAYDLLLNIVWHGSERHYREKTIDLAEIRSGEAVLDIGCGTGTLAIAAKRRVGPAGRVCGLDASREMLARARKKATGAGAEIDFQMGSAGALPFPEATFDVVLSTTVFHCLSDRARDLCIREMARVLKPNGRFLLVDFGGPKRESFSLIGHLRAHRDFDVFDLVPAVRENELSGVKTGSLGFSDLQFIFAKKPSSGGAAVERSGMPDQPSAHAP
jgi:ubiquinone/menaquinone biosynthesis C-methylase UbiE